MWGFDIEKWEGYQGDRLFIMDVRELLKPKNLIPFLAMVKVMGYVILIIVASPPCQEFSYRSFPFKRCQELAANVPPDKTIWQACERIAKECNAPLVLENVRGAQKYMGKAAAHYGPFYLWGDVPALLPIGKPKKGFNDIDNPRGGFGVNKKYENRKWGWSGTQMSKGSSHSQMRKEYSAKVAMIPFELAYWIGKTRLGK